MKIHCCLLDKQCRSFGAPLRLHIDARKYHYTIALTPDARLFRHEKSTWFARDKKKEHVVYSEQED